MGLDTPFVGDALREVCEMMHGDAVLQGEHDSLVYGSPRGWSGSLFLLIKNHFDDAEVVIGP